MISVACLVAVASCNGGDEVLRDREYLPKIPRDELVASWTPRSRPPSLLQSVLARRSPVVGSLVLKLGEDCELTRELGELLVDCADHVPAEPSGKGPCAWRIEGLPERESVSILFAGPDSRWRRVSFGVFRHATTGDLALVGTCGSGDAYGLFRQSDPAR